MIIVHLKIYFEFELKKFFDEVVVGVLILLSFTHANTEFRWWTPSQTPAIETF